MSSEAPFPDPLSSVEAPLPSELETTPFPAPAPKEYDPFEYRHYHPLGACTNKILAHKWDQAQHRKHLLKVKAMGPAIDNEAPKHYVHLEKNLKKKQLKQEQQEAIQRTNTNLLVKMSHIMGVDFKEPSFSRTHERISLLRQAHRQAEQAQIREENAAMQRRLVDRTAPIYDRAKWDQERKQTLHYLQNIAAYPKKFAALLKEAGGEEGGRGRETSLPPPVARPKGADVPPKNGQPGEMRTRSATATASTRKLITASSLHTSPAKPVKKVVAAPVVVPVSEPSKPKQKKPTATVTTVLPNHSSIKKQPVSTINSHSKNAASPVPPKPTAKSPAKPAQESTFAAGVETSSSTAHLSSPAAIKTPLPSKDCLRMSTKSLEQVKTLSSVGGGEKGDVEPALIAAVPIPEPTAQEESKPAEVEQETTLVTEEVRPKEEEQPSEAELAPQAEQSTSDVQE